MCVMRFEARVAWLNEQVSASLGDGGADGVNRIRPKKEAKKIIK